MAPGLYKHEHGPVTKAHTYAEGYGMALTHEYRVTDELNMHSQFPFSYDSISLESELSTLEAR